MAPPLSSTPANAYALLTNIQGFDSFSLGPASSQEEIVRAFETQKLIWHPDKNPGDAQAEQVYNRMLAAYSALMSPDSRRVIDEGLRAAQQQRLSSSSSSSRAAADPLGPSGTSAEPDDGSSSSSSSSSAAMGAGADSGSGGGRLSHGNAATTAAPPRAARSALEASQLRLPAEELGAPPPSARPFAYVDKAPGSATPAAPCRP